MRRKLIIVGGIALVSATLITLFFYNLLSDQMAQQTPQSDTRTVVVAAHDLPRGALLKAGMLEVRRVAVNKAPAEGYADLETLEGRRLIQPLSGGEALLPKHLPKGGDQGLGVAIPPGMRAVTVHVGEYDGVNGVISTGDRVDVLVASAPRSPGRPDISLRTLLQNVEVLATDRLSESALRTKVSPNVMLLVDASAVAELSLADQAGFIRLVLRNPADSDTIADARSATASKVLDLPASSQRRSRPRSAPARRPLPAPVPKPAESTLTRMDAPAPLPSAEPIVSLHLRLAGLGDTALAAMTQGLETAEAKSPLLIARFREGWDAEEAFERLERDGSLEVFAEPSFSLANGRHAAYEQSSDTPTIHLTKEDLDRIGVRVHFGAELAAPGRLVLDVAAQAALPDPEHSTQLGGAELPRVMLRQAETEIVLADRQSFWVRGLIDRPGAWGLLRRLFPNRPLERDRNDELVILVTPRLAVAGAERLTAAVVEGEELMATYAEPTAVAPLDPQQTVAPAYVELKHVLHRRLLESINLDRLAEIDAPRVRREVRNAVAALVAEQDPNLADFEREELIDQVLDEVFGLGPLDPLLQDPTVSDILVTTPRLVYIERNGRLIKTSIRFKDNQHLTRIIQKIVGQAGRRIDESSPMVDCRLPDGSRVNAVIPPIAVEGPLLSIRKFAADPLQADDLVARGALSPEMLEYLSDSVRQRRNILITGGTGSGKTTLLNVLSAYIGVGERIVTIEDTAELQLRQEHVAKMECRPPNLEGEGSIRERQLVINSLRMRPDRIILGEVRGDEALDMLQAMNTGHDGSLATIHANSCADAVHRLEMMVALANSNISAGSIRQQIASAIDIFVQVARLSDGSRKVIEIAETAGIRQGEVKLVQLFVYERTGLDDDGAVEGRFQAVGGKPRFREQMKRCEDQYPDELIRSAGRAGGDEE